MIISKNIKLIIYLLTATYFINLNNKTILAGPLKTGAGEPVVEMDNLVIKFINKAGYKVTEVGDIAALVIKAFLSLLGIIFVSYTIYAGYKWMTASGDEEKVRAAKDTLQRAIIGLIIIIAAYAITYFVFANLPGGPAGGGGTGGNPPY